MLIGICTQNDAGVGLYGDYNDLKSLHETIHHLCNHPDLDEHVSDFALGFAFEVRKSFERARETKAFGNGLERVKYFGANHLWPYFLVQVGLLRWFAKLQPTSAYHHSQLYLLEHITEHALSQKDAETALFCREWLNHFPGLTRDYILQFIEEEAWKFVFVTPPQKRLKSLPDLLRASHWFSDEYRAFEKAARVAAREEGAQLQGREWSDFKW